VIKKEKWVILFKWSAQTKRNNGPAKIAR